VAALLLAGPCLAFQAGPHLAQRAYHVLSPVGCPGGAAPERWQRYLFRETPHQPGPPRPGALAASTARHEGTKCDCCGMDPIVGIRFQCANVPDVDICGNCAMTPGQTFSAGNQPFDQMQWRIHSRPSSGVSSSPQSSAPAARVQATPPVPPPVAPAPAPVAKAPSAPVTEPASGGGQKDVTFTEAVTGRYSKFSVDPDDFDNHVDYRRAIYEAMKDDEDDRRSSGRAVGNQASNDYMKGLDAPEEPERQEWKRPPRRSRGGFPPPPPQDKEE